MQDQFIQYVYLILIILGLVVVANKIGVAYPIMLVLGGLALSFVAAFSAITIDPEMVFLIFLPPLLYEAAWQTSWKEFYRWRKLITGFAFPIVFLTSCIVALASTAIIPGFTMALGFLLGGIVSPPDAVSATAIMRGVKVPKSLSSIIEGESLLNDASSLIVFRFALIAVITGEFTFSNAAGTFFLVASMGIIIGLIVGLAFYFFHKLVTITSSIEIVLTLVTPYCMYYAAESFHFSGVLAVVSGGLFLSGKRQSMLNYKSRMEGVNVWTNMIFVMNGLVFLLIGLQLPSIAKALGEVSLSKAIGYGIAITFILIITRFACTFGVTLFARLISRVIPIAYPDPGWKMPLVSGWAGMRGVVSLAAALSIPITINGTAPFPHRNLILFITFIVILITLVLQGLTLPWLIRKVKIGDKYSAIPELEQEQFIRKKLAQDSLDYLEKKFSGAIKHNTHLANLQARLRIDLNFSEQDMEETSFAFLSEYHQMYLDILEHQRETLALLNRSRDFNEEIIRKYLALIDIEEYKIRVK